MRALKTYGYIQALALMLAGGLCGAAAGVTGVQHDPSVVIYTLMLGGCALGSLASFCAAEMMGG